MALSAGSRLGGRLTSFASPKEVSKKRRPHYLRPFAGRRATCAERLWRGFAGTRLSVQTASETDPAKTAQRRRSYKGIGGQNTNRLAAHCGCLCGPSEAMARLVSNSRQAGPAMGGVGGIRAGGCLSRRRVPPDPHQRHPAQVCPSLCEGTRHGVAFLWPTFLWRSKET